MSNIYYKHNDSYILKKKNICVFCFDNHVIYGASCLLFKTFSLMCCYRSFMAYLMIPLNQNILSFNYMCSLFMLAPDYSRLFLATVGAVGRESYVVEWKHKLPTFGPGFNPRLDYVEACFILHLTA